MKTSTFKLTLRQNDKFLYHTHLNTDLGLHTAREINYRLYQYGISDKAEAHFCGFGEDGKNFIVYIYFEVTEYTGDLIDEIYNTIEEAMGKSLILLEQE